jgi:flagellin-specific chaperone FliS
LKDIENKVTSDDWLGASDILSELTNDLQSYEKSLSEALELYSFIESEWNDLRRKLDSANIKVNDEMRIDAELNVSQCKTFLDDGDIDSTLVALGRTDEIIENLRRRI